MVESQRESVGIVKYSNNYIDQLLGIEWDRILTATINNFLPNIIAKNHDKILLNFLETGIRKFTRETQSVYLKLNNKIIVEVNAMIKFYIDQ